MEAAQPRVGSGLSATCRLPRGVAAIPRRRLPSWSRRLSAARGSSGVGTLLRFRVWGFRALGFRVSI